MYKKSALIYDEKENKIHARTAGRTQSGHKQPDTKRFCRYAFLSLCSELKKRKRKKKHFIIVLHLSRLVGSELKVIGDTSITPHPAFCHHVG